MTAATSLEPRALGGLNYGVGGSGEPLLLLHGLGGSTANWAALLPDLVARFRVVSVDWPGHAGSRALARGAGVGTFAGLAADVLEAEETGPALVVGHSFGGQVALRLAHARPELVGGLLLISPAGIRTTARGVRAVVVAVTLVRPGRFVAPFRNRFAGRRWYRRAVFRPWFVSDADALTPRAVHAVLDDLRLHTDTRTAGRAMLADDPRPDLDGISCPVVLLWGARDAQLPLEDAFEYARRLRAELRLVADCGHLALVERPAACLAALAELEAAVRPGSRSG